MLSDRLISRLQSIDWDFVGSASESPFSAIHWHPCRFASQVPAALIGLLTREGDLVIDPFVGSGTTLVEAQRLRRRSIGIDLNPIACLIARAKTLPSSAIHIATAIESIADEARLALDRRPRLPTTRGRNGKAHTPETVQGNKWYTPRVLRDLGRLWAWIQELPNSDRVLAEAAFSAILLPVCRETRHWGYVCDNTQPQSDHEGDVEREFVAELARLKAAYVDRDAEWQARGVIGTAEVTVTNGDAAQSLRVVPDSAAKLVLTSPPYFGVCDYIKSQRLSLEWFGLPIEPHRRAEIGARSKRHRKTAAADYLTEMRPVLREARRCTSRSGHLVLVVGESASRKAVLRELLGAAVEEGWKQVLDVERRVSAQRRQTPSIMTEHVVIFDRK